MLDGKTLVVRKSDPGGTKDTLSLTDLLLVSADEEGAEGQITSISEIVDLIEADTLNDQITALTEATTNSKSDYIPSQQSGTTKKVKTEVILGTPLSKVGLMDDNSFARLTDNICFNPVKARDKCSLNGNAFDSLKRIGQNEAIGINLPNSTGSSLGVSVANNTNLNVGSNDFTRGQFGRFTSIPASGAKYYLCNKYTITGDQREVMLRISAMTSTTATFDLFVSTDGTSGTAVVRATKSNHVIDITKNHMYEIKRSGSTWYIIIDNIIIATGTASITAFAGTGVYNPVGIVYSGTISTVWECGFHLNYATTALEDTILYNSGHPDLAVIPTGMKWGNNTELHAYPNLTGTGGTLTGVTGQTADGWNAFASGGSCTASKDGSDNQVLNASGATLVYRGIANMTFTAGEKRNLIVNVSSLTGTLSVILRTLDGSVLCTDSFQLSSGLNKITMPILLSSTVANVSFALSDGGSATIDYIHLEKAGIVALYRPAGINIPAVGSLSSTETTTVTQYQPYEITADITTGEASTIGAVSNLAGTRFVAKAGAILSGSGKVKPVYADTWYDESTNALNATTSGFPGIVLVNKEQVFGEGLLGGNLPYITKAITATTSTDCGQIPAGFELLRIWAVVTGGTGVTGFTLGNSSSGTQILTSTSLAVGDNIIVPTGRPVSSTANQTIYSNATSLGGGTLTIYMTLLKLFRG